MNAQFRFVLKPSFDSRHHLVNPDLPLPWHDIVQVLVPSTSDTCSRAHGSFEAMQATTCPICLSPPIAPRITQCGHVYCYACILHYLTVAENGKGDRGVLRYIKRCPVCWDDVNMRDLKAVKWIDSQNIADVHTATYLRELEARGAPKLQHNESFGILTMRLMERPRDSSLALPRSSTWPVDASMGLSCEHPDALTYAHCVLASPDLLASSLEVDMENVEFEMKPEHAIHQDELSLDFLRVAHTNLKSQWEQAKSLPDVARCMQEKQPSAHSYLYYQAASGQHVFMHPIDIKVLLSHFGTYTAFPDTLMLAVQHVEEGTVDETLRKKCKYLAHLPMSTDISFVEIDWARTSALLGPIQGDIPWKSWSATLSQRKQRRLEKATKEERARQRAEKDSKDARSRSAAEHIEREAPRVFAAETSELSFRDSAMVGAEMYFPIHPGANEDPAALFPSMPSQSSSQSRSAHQPKTVWGTPAATSIHTDETPETRQMDDAWNALESRSNIDVPSQPHDKSKQRTKRKPKLILTGGGRSAL